MRSKRIVIGTRGSTLALWQTQYVAERLRAATPNLDIHVKTIQTRGDLVRDRAQSQVGGKGLFVKEIENALSSGEIDLAVHSLKDMPTEQPKGLTLGAILERADPHDALVVHGGAGDLGSLSPGARVGTTSPRRRAQLLATRPDLQVLDLRGNVDARLRKLREGQYDAVVLAVAGLERLGHVDAISQVLPLDLMLPAVGQGALCIEMRAAPRDDAAAPGNATQNLISVLDHPVLAEYTRPFQPSLALRFLGNHPKGVLAENAHPSRYQPIRPLFLIEVAVATGDQDFFGARHFAKLSDWQTDSSGQSGVYPGFTPAVCCPNPAISGLFYNNKEGPLRMLEAVPPYRPHYGKWRHMPPRDLERTPCRHPCRA